MFKIGQSTDIHVFAKERPCIIGGVDIPHEEGLLGHSDADVLLHVVAESIFGAMGIGDLGEHFSDLDEKNKDLDSKDLVLFAMKEAKKQGYQLGNIDTLVMCEVPKLSPYKETMKNNIAELLETDPANVNVKATTSEKIGPIGRKEGIMAQAVVLMVKA